MRSTPTWPPRSSTTAASPIWPACCRCCVIARAHRPSATGSIAPFAPCSSCSRRNAAVVVLDDLQWSDDASIELIAAMLRREWPRRCCWRWVTAPGVPSKLASALAEPGDVLELGPLSEADCSTLVGEHVDAPQRAAVFEQSGGNPFYTLQLARAAAADRGAFRDRLARDAGVPRRSRPRWSKSSGRWRTGAPASGVGVDRRRPVRAGACVRDRRAAADGRASRRSTSCSTPGCCIPPMCRAGSRSGTRSCAVPSTRPARPAGG